MNRDDYRDQFAPLLDDELAPEEREALEAALSQDSELLRELETIKRVDALYRALPRAEAPADFEDRVKTELRPNVLWFGRKGLPKFRLAPSLVAAAGVFIVIGVIYFNLPGTVGKRSAAFEMAQMSDEQASMADEAAADVAGEQEHDSQYRNLQMIEEPAADAPAPARKTEEQELAASIPESADRAESDMAGGAVADDGTRVGGAPAAAPPAPVPAEPLAEPGFQTAAGNVRHVADRAFVMSHGIWVQEGYADEKTALVDAESDAFAALVADEPGLDAITSFAAPVTFKAGDAWYTLAPPVSD